MKKSTTSGFESTFVKCLSIEVVGLSGLGPPDKELSTGPQREGLVVSGTPRSIPPGTWESNTHTHDSIDRSVLKMKPKMPKGVPVVCSARFAGNGVISCQANAKKKKQT